MTRGGPERDRGRDNESAVSKAQAQQNVPRARPPRPGDSSHAARCPTGGRLRTCRRLRRRPDDKWGGGDSAFEYRGRSGRGAGTVGRQAGGGTARSQTARGRTWGSPGARAGAGGEGRPGRYLLLDLPVLRDDPVRGGEGPSSRHTQQGGKAEEPAWAGARRQLAPAADPYCRRHLAPPVPLLTPEAEAGPRRPPSWGGRRWRRWSPGCTAG